MVNIVLCEKSSNSQLGQEPSVNNLHIVYIIIYLTFISLNV